MQKTLFVSDLDGTLLNSQSVLSPTTIDLLNRAIDGGALFTVATARTPATVVELLAQVHTQLPFVVMAGAAWWDGASQCYDAIQVIPEPTLQRILDAFNNHGINPLIYRLCQGMLTVSHQGQLSKMERDFVEQRQSYRLKQFLLPDDQYRTRAGQATNLFSMHPYEQLKPVYEQIVAQSECSAFLYRDIFDNSAGYLEVYAPGTNKAASVKRLAQQLGVERIVAFGDNDNDLPMLELADHAVAPANAMEHVRRAADEVIESNDTDAVARYIIDHM